MSYENDAEVLKRLRRAQGHLSSVVAMVDSSREGLEIAQQLQSVIKALQGAKQMLIHQHIDETLDKIAGAPAEKAQAFVANVKELSKYL